MSNIDFDKTTVHEALPVVGQNFPPVPPNVGSVISGGSGSGINFPLSANLGGTGFSAFQVGDILYADTTSTLAKLSPTTNGFVLTLDAGLPKWAAIAAIGVIGGAGTAGKISKFATAFTIGDSILTELGSLITVTGNLAATGLTASNYVKTDASKVLVSVATIPSADISNTSFVTSVTGTASRITSSGGLTPSIDIDAAYIGQSSITTLGTISTGVWNGTVIGPTFGGTGIASYAAGSIIYASASNVLSSLPATTNGFILTLVGGFPAWATPVATIGGSGTIGTIPKFSTSTALTDSLIIESGGGIGIGSSPTVGKKFDVENKFVINDGSTEWGAARDYGKLGWDPGIAIVGGLSGKDLSLHANNLEKARLTTGGFFGINLTPAYRFDVLDSTAAGRAGNFKQSSSTGYGIVITPGADATYEALRIRNAADSLTQHSFFGSGDVSLCQTAGKLGVGTASAISLLEVKAADTIPGVITVGGGKVTVTSIGEINAQIDFRSNDFSVNNTNEIGGRIASITESTSGAFVGLGFYTFNQAAGTQLGEKMRISYNGNIGIGTASFGTSMVGGMAMLNGTAPSGGVTDCFQMYSADIAAGNAAPHFRTELGNVIKLFKSAAYTPTNVVSDRAYDANATTLDEVADVLGTLIADLQLTGLIG